METLEKARVSRNLYRNVYIFFVLLIPAALLGFGKSFFSGLTFSGKSATVLVNAHTAFMVLWLFILIAQAWFIRTKRFQLHRWVGRSTFVIAPVIIILSLSTAHQSLTRMTESRTLADYQIELYTWGQMIGFGLSWGLAILYRRNTPLHIRFMISTVFAIGSAIVLRIILNWFSWVPGMDTLDGVAAANGAVLILSLLSLIALDWRLGIKRSPFWVVTIVIGIMHIGYFTFSKTDGWRAFVEWFIGLP